MNSGLKQTFNRNSVWCKGRTNMERRLIMLALIILSITLALAIALAIVVNRTSEDKDTEVCSTPGCIHAAANVFKFIDSSVDPCDNFYAFACGNYLKETIIPEDKSEVGAFITISDTVRDQIKAIIEEPLKPRARKPFKLLKQYYDICMDTAAIEADGLKTAKAMLKELGGWPLIEENWNEGKFEWRQSVYKFRKQGFSDSYFISFSVGLEDINSIKRMIFMDQPRLSLSREFLIKGLEEKRVKAYYDYMVDIAVMFGANRAAALKEMKETLEFEIKLANISLPKEERRNSTLLYNPISVEELQYKFPTINWLEYIKNVLDIPDIDITYDELVVVTVPNYITALMDLLTRTPKRIQANYIMRRAALSLTFYLTEKIRGRQLDYYKIINGKAERESRRKECTQLACKSVHLALGSMYVQKYFDEDAKKHAQDIVTDIRAEFVKILKEVDWMDNVTRENAIDKVDSMTTHIGYPDELLDEEKIDKYYTNLEIDSESYLRSMIAMNLFNLEDSYKQLRKPPLNKTHWLYYSYPTWVIAFYALGSNSIQFTAGILQGIYFSDDRPAYMNYGGIGYVIGHEITHGVDDEGRQHDKEGNLHDWWGDSTKEAFVKKAKCIIEQYSNYTVSEVNLNLNGVNTQRENIADNGGIKSAYLAYNNWVERNGDEPRLPGLDYTPNQLFWISAAHSWCTRARKEVLKLQVTTGFHSPGRYRVLVPFANTEYFAKDFNCPVGSTMNPTHKCKVW